MSIVVVGSVAYDSIKTPRGNVERVLGGAACYFSLAAGFFTDVKIVAAVGEDFEQEHIDLLKGKGVDISGLDRVPGKTFHWSGEYSGDMNTARTRDTQLGVFADFNPKLSESHRKTPFVFLANIDPELQINVLDQMDNPKLVALDTMNFWITGKPKELQKALGRIDMLFVNDGEAKMLAGSDNIMRAAREIRAMGPKCVVIKRGEYGAIIFHEAGMFAVPAYPLETVFDPTGAGDSFGGGFMGYLAQAGEATMKNIRTAAVYGSTVASFACEDFSLRRLARLAKPEIEERFEFFRELTKF
jgi:sugar/nucleoside kinase (ribokinase family)